MDTTPLGRAHALTVITFGLAVMPLTGLPHLPPWSLVVILLAGAFLVVLGAVELSRSKRATEDTPSPSGNISVMGDVSGHAVAIGHQASASVNQAKKPAMEEVFKMDAPEQHDGNFRIILEARIVVHSFAPGLLTVNAKNPKLVSLHVEGLDRKATMQMIGGPENGDAISETPNPMGRYRITVVTSDESDTLVLCYLDHEFTLGWKPK